MCYLYIQSQRVGIAVITPHLVKYQLAWDHPANTIRKQSQYFGLPLRYDSAFRPERHRGQIRVKYRFTDII